MPPFAFAGVVQLESWAVFFPWRAHHLAWFPALLEFFGQNAKDHPASTKPALSWGRLATARHAPVLDSLQVLFQRHA
jgi:hypothetical protein